MSDTKETAGADAPALTRAEILALDDTPLERVTVPHWGERAVFVRALNAGERDEYMQRAYADKGSREWRLRHRSAFLVYSCACDQDGNRLFTDPADIDAIARKSGEAIGYLVKVIDRKNGLTPDAVEKLRKNS